MKALLGTRIGHCGTLDPFAEGLLIAVSGACTKIASYFQALPKSYQADICFGATTDTLDPEGEVVARAPLPIEDTVRRQIAAMCGRQMQVPPQYSAVKVGGERAYMRARHGMHTAISARPVEVYSFRLHGYRPPIATVTLTVSTGTYIRAIARDLAQRCGTVAYLTALQRTHIGSFAVADGHVPSAFRVHHLIPPHRLASLNARCKAFVVPARYHHRIQHGGELHRIDYFCTPEYALAEDECALLFEAPSTFEAPSALLAICAYREQQLRYLYVCSSAAD